MKFSIQQMLVLTFISALLIHLIVRWNGLHSIRSNISQLEYQIDRQGFDGHHVDMMLQLCESAVADTELPPRAYRSAEANYLRTHPGETFGREY